jgi:hypothetical protein
VYKLDIKEEIGPAIWRKTQQAFEEAESLNADIQFFKLRDENNKEITER